ncbi:MAG: ATP-binding protein [Candidatus Cyclobacteriaceae bacterium M3_2C_046]
MIRKLLHIVLLLIFFWPVLTQAQNQVADSIRLDQLINEASGNFSIEQYDMVIEAAMDAYTLADAQNNDEFRLKALMLLAQSYQHKSQISSSIKYFLEALSLAEKNYDYQNLFQIYLKLARLYQQDGVSNKALDYFLQAEKVNSTLQDPTSEKTLAWHIGNTYTELEAYDQALPYFERLEKLYQQQNDYDNQVRVLRKMIYISTRTKNYQAALDCNLRILELFKHKSDIRGVLSTENNLGYIYTYLKEYKKALFNFQNVLLLDEQINSDPDHISTSIVNLGIAYQNVGQLDSAVNTFLRALVIQVEQKDYPEIARINNLLATTYIQKNDYHNARFYSQYAIESAKRGEDLQVLQYSYRIASQLARQYNDYEEALEQYQNYLAIRDSLLVEQRISQQEQARKQLNLEKTENDLMLLMADEKVKEMTINQLRLEAEKQERELDLLRQEKELQDLALKKEELEKQRALELLVAQQKDQDIQLLQQEKEMQSILLERKELQEKERKNQIALLEQQKRFQAQQLDKEQKIRTYSYGLLVLGFLVMVLMAIGYINLKRTSKKLAAQKQAIEQKNEQLEHKSKEIMTQNELLEDQNARMEKQRKEIAEAYDLLNQTHQKLKNAQSQMIEQEKMASLGQLTAGIAHEINNPINFVSSNINPLRLDIEDIKTLFHQYDGLVNSQDIHQELVRIEAYKKEIDVDFLFEEIYALLNGIEEGAVRTKDIVAGLRKFSRVDHQTLGLGNIHEGLESTLLLLKNSYKNRIEVIKDYDETLPLIHCFPGKLNQVFMNILNNAVQAIEHKGTIQIQTNQVKLNKQEFARITINDSGPGISRENLSKIFDPFFTTKTVGEGTGLGLSISYGIIQQHKGKIEVQSKPGKGTEFTILLPLDLKEQMQTDDGKQLVSKS